MDIYITNLETRETLIIPMLPQEVSGTIGNRFASYQIIKNGEVKIPTGTNLDSYTWSGTFPGAFRYAYPFIRHKKAPKKCDKFMQGLKAKHGKAVKARLMITETNINLDVYLESYTPKEVGGYGDIQYTVKFIRAKKLSVKKSAKAATPLKNSPPADASSRTGDQGNTYTVVKGDCLWKIAQKFYGAGKEYPKIYQANKATIDAHHGGPNMIWPGDVLTIP